MFGDKYKVLQRENESTFSHLPRICHSKNGLCFYTQKVKTIREMRTPEDKQGVPRQLGMDDKLCPVICTWGGWNKGFTPEPAEIWKAFQIERRRSREGIRRCQNCFIKYACVDIVWWRQRTRTSVFRIRIGSLSYPKGTPNFVRLKISHEDRMQPCSDWGGLAVVFGLEKFVNNIYGKREVESDHKPLEIKHRIKST